MTQNDPLAICLSFLAKQKGRLYSTHALTANLPLCRGVLDKNNFIEASARAGFYSEYKKVSVEDIPSFVLPVIVVLKDGAAILTRKKDDYVELIYPDNEKTPVYKKVLEFEEEYTGEAIYLKDIFLDEGDDTRKYVDALSGKKGWFKEVLYRFKGLYINVGIASFIINLLGIVSSLYVMNVYDRVIPIQAEATLLALSIGVFIAYIFDFLLKTLRAYFIDTAGKKSDIILSSVIFSSVMNVRLDNKPGSSGSFANIIRDFESVREFFTSSTLSAFIDVPFIFIFIGVIFLISGQLGFVILVAVILVFCINLLLQIPLKKLVNENLREASYKHSLLVESLTSLEQVKALRAQGIMRGKWEDVTGLLAINSMSSKFYTSVASNATQFVQQMTTMMIVFFGCYLVFEGDMTMGGLIACVILTGRAVGPLMQTTSLSSRYQSMRLSLENIDSFILKDNEMSLDKSLLSRPILEGGFEFRDVHFSYPNQSAKALDGVSFIVKPKEKIAILGQNGAGKSSILRLLMNFYHAKEGNILTDGIDIKQIDIADLRANISYLPQNPNLFLGSLRDNILLANPMLSDDEMLTLLANTNLLSLVQGQDQGLDLQVGELGGQLSGGQRQTVALSASLANEGSLVLMDEPTSSMDKGSEQHFVINMKRVLKDKTFILSTHKPELLALVDRIIILEKGKIVIDGEKNEVLKQLSQNQKSKNMENQNV